MYGNRPATWTDDLTGYGRLCMIVDVFTRMRAPTCEGELDYEYKSTSKKMSLYLRPWFKAPDRRSLDYITVFGHWPSLGYVNIGQVIALDTGTLRGGELTAIDLDTSEAIQVSSSDGLDQKTTLKQFG